MSSNPLSLTAIALFLDAGLQVLDVKNQALGAILLIIVAFLIFYTITDWLQLPKRFRKQLPAFKELTFGANIPLPKAAQIAYEEARLSGYMGPSSRTTKHQENARRNIGLSSYLYRRKD